MRKLNLDIENLCHENNQQNKLSIKKTFIILHVKHASLSKMRISNFEKFLKFSE